MRAGENLWGSPISVGRFVARQCLGAASHGYAKPIFGISDLAQLAYCEIKSTISQIASRQGYMTHVFMDDGTDGVRKSSRPSLTTEEKRETTDTLRKLFENERTQDFSGARLARGRIAEDIELAGTVTERRHFDFAEFLLIGVPDALIANELVIEFASSRQPYLTAKDKLLQANVYAVLWGVPKYQVIVAHPTTGQRVATDGTADIALAEQTISTMWELLSGRRSVRPPNNPNKCISCPYRLSCPFPGSGHIATIEEMKRIAIRH